MIVGGGRSMAAINLHIPSKSSASAETDPEWTCPSQPVRSHRTSQRLLLRQGWMLLSALFAELFFVSYFSCFTHTVFLTGGKAKWSFPPSYPILQPMHQFHYV